MADLWQDPLARRWIRRVLDDMAPKMAGSAIVASIAPDDPEGDVKYWVELGASICMDKPIVLVVFGDRTIPAKLERVADEIVRCPDGVDPSSSADLAAALSRVVGRLEGDET